MSDERVDELRQRLRSLGYLDAGVDRFVLGSAQATRRPATLAVLAGVRIGLLSALLLGPIAAAGLGLRIPGLVSSARDALVLALYLGALFFLVTAVLSAGVSLVASAFVRAGGERSTSRAQRASRLAAWSTDDRVSRLLDAVVARGQHGVRVEHAALDGHRARNRGDRQPAARTRCPDHDARSSAAATPASLPPVSTRSWRVVLVGGTLAFLGGAALLILTAPAATNAPSVHQPLTVVSSGHRVRLLAIDGFDEEAYAAATRAATLPAGGGIRAYFEPQDTSDPARAWTTIATGVPAEVHGVASIETRRVAGVQGTIGTETSAVGRIVRTATDLLRLTRPSITSREERRAKTVWEVAAEAGLRTAVINWWATWPATANNGIVITDRAVLRLERGGPLDAEVAPADLYEPLRRAWPALRTRAAAVAGGSFGTISDPEVLSVLRRSAELDATIVGLWSALPEPGRDLDVLVSAGPRHRTAHAVGVRSERGAAAIGDGGAHRRLARLLSLSRRARLRRR